MGACANKTEKYADKKLKRFKSGHHELQEERVENFSEYAFNYGAEDQSPQEKKTSIVEKRRLLAK